MNIYLKGVFFLLLLATSIFLFWLSNRNEFLLQDSFYRLSTGEVSDFKPRNRIHEYYQGLERHYEAEENEQKHKKVNIDSMWNTLSAALDGETPVEVTKYHVIKWEDAKTPAEKEISEVTQIAKASDKLDSIIKFVKTKYATGFTGDRSAVTKELAGKYFSDQLKIEKDHQTALWQSFQQYSKSVSFLFENSLVKRKELLDSVWMELNRIARSVKRGQEQSWPAKVRWDFFYVAKPIGIDSAEVSYLISRTRPVVESNALLKFKNESNRLNSLFAADGKFQLGKKIYSLDDVTQGELHSILKAILIYKDLTDDALISSYEESVKL